MKWDLTRARQRGAVVATLALVLSASAGAQTIARDLFYTRNFAAGAEPNVKKVTTTYDRTAGTFSLSPVSPNVGIAQTNGADGIIFAPDGQLLIGGQSTGLVHKLATSGPPVVSFASGVGGAFHLSLDPSGNKVWVAGIPGGLAEMPLSPAFGPGTARPLNGSDTVVTSLAFAAGKVWYTTSTPSGFGNFGEINLTTFTTTRIYTNLEGAHGMVFDPFTGHLMLFGAKKIRQIDPAAAGAPIVSTLDVTSIVPAGFDLDQGAVDGQGLMYGASNDGNLIFVDYAAAPRQVGTPTNFKAVRFLDNNLDDIAPLVGPGAPNCCEIGTGDFDRRNGQMSQLSEVPTVTEFRVADDFYLCEAGVYRIRSVTGTLLTTDLTTALTDLKATLELYEDCDGAPGTLIGTYINATFASGGPNFDGHRVVKPTFQIPNLWLRGGRAYWVAIMGRNGDRTAIPTWAFATAGSGTVRGRPGMFKSAGGGYPNWTPIDQLCCGCTDFAFCVEATGCKILNDNGTYDLTSGSPSIVNTQNAFDSVKTADDFVIPPCEARMLCYIEGYLASNCRAFAMDLYANDCKLPGASIRLNISPRRFTDLGRITQGPYAGLNLWYVQFWDLGVTLAGGKNYWLSIHGVGDGTLNQRAYWLKNRDCERDCLIRFNAGAIRGPQASNPDWVRVSPPKDFNYLLAIDDPSLFGADPGTGGSRACAADINRDGNVSAQDVFDFVQSWFNGCP